MAKADHLKCQSFVEATLNLLGAQKYIPEFKKHNIDSLMLPTLTEQDLKFLGIEDADLQQNIIKRCKNLAINDEYKIDDDYILDVITNIDKHLTVIHAWLSCALLREDIDNSHVKLSKTINILKNETISLQSDMEKLYTKFGPLPTKTKSKWKYIMALCITSTVSICMLKYLLKNK